MIMKERAPLDTPLACLVTVDPSIGVLERDHSAKHERAWPFKHL
jgi:hypothetical protein